MAGSQAGAPALPVASGSAARGTDAAQMAALPINASTGQPRQIAQALIRSMLGLGTSTAKLPPANEPLPAKVSSRPGGAGGPAAPPAGGPSLPDWSPAVAAPLAVAPLPVPGNPLSPAGTTAETAASAVPSDPPWAMAVSGGLDKSLASPLATAAVSEATVPGAVPPPDVPSASLPGLLPGLGKGVPAGEPLGSFRGAAIYAAAIQTAAMSGSAPSRPIGSAPLAFALRLTPHTNSAGGGLPSAVEGKSAVRPVSPPAVSSPVLDQPAAGSGIRTSGAAAQVGSAESPGAGAVPFSTANASGSAFPDSRDPGPLSNPAASPPSGQTADNESLPRSGPASSTANSAANATVLKSPPPGDTAPEDKAPEDSAADGKAQDDNAPAAAAAAVPSNSEASPSGWAGAESPLSGNRSTVTGKPDPAAPVLPAWPVPAPAPESSSPGAAQTPAAGISLRIATPGAAPVDVQMAERGGQVHVAVRTSDPGLESSLRQDLNTLVDSLERSGFRSEVLTPGNAPALTQAAAGSAAGQNASQDASQHSSQNSGRQDAPGQDTNGQNSGKPFQSGAGGSGQRQRQPQQRPPETPWTVSALASSRPISASLATSFSATDSKENPSL